MEGEGSGIRCREGRVVQKTLCKPHVLLSKSSLGVSAASLLPQISGSLIARQYAPFVLGQTSTGMTIMILVIPLLVNAITVDNSPVQWAWCFRIVAGFMILADIFYVLFASGEPCEWALCTDRVRPSIRPTGLYVPSKEPSEASGSRHPSEEIAVP